MNNALKYTGSTHGCTVILPENIQRVGLVARNHRKCWHHSADCFHVSPRRSQLERRALEASLSNDYIVSWAFPLGCNPDSLGDCVGKSRLFQIPIVASHVPGVPTTFKQTDFVCERQEAARYKNQAVLCVCM